MMLFTNSVPFKYEVQLLLNKYTPMVLGKQKLSLAYLITNQSSVYWLHSISTLTDSRAIIDPDTPTVMETVDGVHTVKLYVKIDPSVEEFSYGTPVYHLLPLNGLDLTANGEADIIVDVWEGTEKKGSKTIAQSTATEVRRPFD